MGFPQFMKSNGKKARKIWDKFQDKEYRNAYSDQNIFTKISSQISFMRKHRGWSQEQLAKEAGMSQPRISKIEDPDNSQLSLSTLQRIASAFDVSLNVEFVPFSTLVNSSLNESVETLTPVGFEFDSLNVITDSNGMVYLADIPSEDCDNNSELISITESEGKRISWMQNHLVGTIDKVLVTHQ